MSSDNRAEVAAGNLRHLFLKVPASSPDELASYAFHPFHAGKDQLLLFPMLPPATTTPAPKSAPSSFLLLLLLLLLCNSPPLRLSYSSAFLLLLVPCRSVVSLASSFCRHAVFHEGVSFGEYLRMCTKNVFGAIRAREYCACRSFRHVVLKRGLELENSL